MKTQAPPLPAMFESYLDHTFNPHMRLTLEYNAAVATNLLRERFDLKFQTTITLEMVKHYLEHRYPMMITRSQYDREISKLQKLDLIIRFFARQNDVQYIIGSVAFVVKRPAISFEVFWPSIRRIRKYKKLGDIILQNPQMDQYKKDRSIVFCGVPHEAWAGRQLVIHAGMVIRKHHFKVAENVGQRNIQGY